jgi:hypothetical protein
LPVALSNALILGEMIMYDGLTTGQSHRQGRAVMRGAVATLRRAWTAYTLERAIADVASMGDEDYLQFGLDRAEILEALARLRDEVATEATSADDSDTVDGSRLAVVVNRRKPTLLAKP